MFFSNSELQINFCKVEGLVCKKHKTQLWVESYFFGKYTVFSYKCMDYRVLVVKFRVFEKKKFRLCVDCEEIGGCFCEKLRSTCYCCKVWGLFCKIADENQIFMKVWVLMCKNI